jgi:phosphoribosylformimino-5-aminoimidazole carboxamide ribonucleotide (ProFAR) isomerase
VDVADGKAVRLTQGEAGTETSYGDPVEAADLWASQGAEWIHLVDLDDIAALRELVPLGLEGAIVGKALYARAFTLAAALDVAGG